MPTHEIEYNWSSGNAQISKRVSKSSDAEINIDVTVPGSTTNMEIDLVATVANLKSVFISSDQALTIKTNDSGSPDETISLAANVPYVWQHGSGLSNILETNLTQIFATNAGSDSAALKIRLLIDITP